MNEQELVELAQSIHSRHGDTPTGRQQARRELRQKMGSGNLLDFVKMLMMLFSLLRELDERRNDET